MRIHCTFYGINGTILSDYNDATWQLSASYTTHTWNLPTSPIGTSYAVVGFRLFNTDGSRWPVTNVTTIIDNVQLWENYVGVKLMTSISGTGTGEIILSPTTIDDVYSEGTQVTLTANPSIGSEFISWDGDINSISNPVVITMDSDKNIMGVINESLIPNNILGSLNGYLEEGTIKNWRAIEVSGGNVHSIENDLTKSTVEITNNAYNGNYAALITWAIDPSIEDIIFDINTSIKPETNYILKAASKSLSGSCILRMHCTFYDINGVILGDYNDATWQLNSNFTTKEWSIPRSPTGSVATVVGFRVFNPDGSRWPDSAVTTIIDDVQLWENSVGVEYTLATSMLGTGTGNLDINPSGGIYKPGDQVTVTATPYYGSEFENWSGSMSSTSNTVVVNMDGNKNISATITDQTASFVEIVPNEINGVYAAQFTWKEDPAIEDLLFDLNSDVNSNTDYIFEANAKSLSGPCILRMHCTFYDVNGVIISDYNDATWQLTDVFQNHQWSVPTSPENTSFAVIGFRVYNTDGSRWANSDITTIIDDVKFWDNGVTPIEYKLVTTISGTGIGNVLLDPTGGIYTIGTQVTVTAVPESGNEFIEWSEGITGTTNPIVITIDGDKNITATFNKLYSENNLLSGWNGDFELGSIQNWRALEVDGSTVLSVENDPTVSSVAITTDSYGGIYAANYTWGVSTMINDIVFDFNIPITGQKEYTFRAAAKSLNQCILRIHSTFYDTNNNVLGDYNDVTWQLSNSYQVHEWEIPISPIGSTFVVVGFRLFNSDGSRWPSANISTIIDEVELLEFVPIGKKALSNNIVEIEKTNLSIYPNPFKKSIVFEYNLINNSRVILKIYNIRGQLVHVLTDNEQETGHHSIKWDGGNAPNGIYIAKLDVSNNVPQFFKIVLNR